MKVRVELFNRRGFLLSFYPQTKIEKAMLEALSYFRNVCDGGSRKLTIFFPVSTISLDGNLIAFNMLKDCIKKQRKLDKSTASRRWTVKKAKLFTGLFHNKGGING